MNVKQPIFLISFIIFNFLSADYFLKQPIKEPDSLSFEDTLNSRTFSSCQEAYNAGARVSGIYSIDYTGGNNPSQTSCDMTSFNGGWTQCFELTNTSNVDLNNNNWLNNCIDIGRSSNFSNNIMVKLTKDNNVVYNAWGSFQKTWTYNYITTSNLAANNQYYYSNHNRLISLNNGHVLGISGQFSANNGCGGSYGNGYGLAIKSASAYTDKNILIVFPYYSMNNISTPRSFYNWSQSSEISYNNGTEFNTCGSTPAYVDSKFEIFIR